MQSGVNYSDILKRIEQNWRTTHLENQHKYANAPLYNLILFLRDNEVPFSAYSRKTVNDILVKASSGNVFEMTAEDMTLIVELINKSIYDSIRKQNSLLAPVYHKPAKSYFYKSDFVNNLLYSFIRSASNNNKVNNYTAYTEQAAICVKKLISGSKDDKLFYGQNKDKLIDALDSPERDNAAALCRLMYVKNLSVEDALASIKNILTSVMEYKFKDKNDFIGIAYCKYFCAQIDKLKLNNGFDEQTNQTINSANAFFEKDFVPDLDEIKEFLPEFKMPDKRIGPERLRQMALFDVERENTHLVDEQRRLKNEVMNQKFEPKDDVDAWKQHYKKLIKFYDAFQTKDINPVGKLTQGQKDYAFLCGKAEIFKSVMESCCKKEYKSTRWESGKEYPMVQRVEYYYDNIQIVNNVTQKIIDALKSNDDGEKSVAFWFINLFMSSKQTASINSLKIIDKILSVEGQVDENTKFTILKGVINYLKGKEKNLKDLDSKYKNGSTEDFDKAVSDFLATSKNDLKIWSHLVKKGIIEKNIYEEYKTRLDNATDLNLIITALYWFVNLLGVAISLGQWKACVRAVKSPEKVRMFNRIPKSLDIKSDKNEGFNK